MSRMRRKIEFFESNNIWNLQEQVNDFLSENIENDILDVQYCQSSTHLPNTNDDDWNIIYTAMVFYKTY